MSKLKIPRHYVRTGETLQYLRTLSDLTQKQVADRLGYSSAQFISNFERGIAVPPLKKLKVLVRMYGADRDQLVELILDDERDRIRKLLK